MKVFVYLDESGSIHKNSKSRYFAVGGYFTFEEDKIKIISKYRKINYKLKKQNNISLNKEIKSYDMTESEKIDIFSKIRMFTIKHLRKRGLSHTEIPPNNHY